MKEILLPFLALILMASHSTNAMESSYQQVGEDDPNNGLDLEGKTKLIDECIEKQFPNLTRMPSLLGLFSTDDKMKEVLKLVGIKTQFEDQSNLICEKLFKINQLFKEAIEWSIFLAQREFHRVTGETIDKLQNLEEDSSQYDHCEIPKPLQNYIYKKAFESFFTQEEKSYRYTLTGDKAKINELALHFSLKQVASASADNTVRIWSLETGKILYTYGCKNPPTGIAYDVDDIHRLAVCSNTEFVDIIDPSTGKLLFSIPFPVPIYAVSLAQKKLIAATEKHVFYLVDTSDESKRQKTRFFLPYAKTNSEVYSRLRNNLRVEVHPNKKDIIFTKESASFALCKKALENSISRPEHMNTLLESQSVKKLTPLEYELLLKK